MLVSLPLHCASVNRQSYSGVRRLGNVLSILSDLTSAIIDLFTNLVEAILGTSASDYSIGEIFLVLFLSVIEGVLFLCALIFQFGRKITLGEFQRPERPELWRPDTTNRISPRNRKRELVNVLLLAFILFSVFILARQLIA